MTTRNADESLVNFAAAVRTAASRAGNEHRFGRHKVFIAALSPSAATKRLLVEAHRAGLLRLCRADLITAMDPAVVAASEVEYLTARFHLVDLEAA